MFKQSRYITALGAAVEYSILNLLQQDGRKINARGMCYGIAMAVIDYAIKCSELKQLDQKQLQPFGTRLREIITCQDKDKEKQAQRSAFFDAIMLYHSNRLDALLEDEKALDELKQNFQPHPNYQTSFWAWSILNNNRGNTKPLYENYSFMLHAPDSEALEEKVISTLETLRQGVSVFGALLSIIGHAMSAVYDQGKWWLINHDSFNYLENSLGRLLKKSMVSIKVLSTVKDNTHQEIVRSLNNTIPENNQKKPAYFNLAMGEGHADCVRAYFNALKEEKDLTGEQLISLIRAEGRNWNGTPALYLAMRTGHADCVRAYFDFLREDNLREDNQLSEDQRISLIRADWNGTPALYTAMEIGHADYVQVYYDFLREDNQLSEDQRISLIRSDSREGFPALSIAMRKGHADCVRAYFNALKEEKDLTGEQLISLIRAEGRNWNGTPALYVAMRTGHADCVRAYFDFLREDNLREDNQLSEDQRISLIRSDIGGLPALYAAMRKGRADCVRVYYEFLVNDGQLSVLALRSLALEEWNGRTAIESAIDFNYEKIIDIYLHAVYQICKKTWVSSNQLVPVSLQEQYRKYSNDQFIRDFRIQYHPSLFSTQWGPNLEVLEQAEDPRALALDHARNGNGVQTRRALEKIGILQPEDDEKQSTCVMM